jgi:hypothetical protein
LGSLAIAAIYHDRASREREAMIGQAGQAQI